MINNEYKTNEEIDAITGHIAMLACIEAMGDYSTAEYDQCEMSRRIIKGVVAANKAINKEAKRIGKDKRCKYFFIHVEPVDVAAVAFWIWSQEKGETEGFSHRSQVGRILLSFAQSMQTIKLIQDIEYITGDDGCEILNSVYSVASIGKKLGLLK